MTSNDGLNPLNNESERTDELKQLIDESNNIVFFTGAGISTESGIPDFRSPKTGIWNKISPIEFSEYLASEEKRTESWRRKFGGDRKMFTAKPNKGHEAIAILIEQQKAKAVITQNVDNLHQESGIDDYKIVELHGNSRYATCLDCNTRYELADLEIEFNKINRVSPCSRCGGIIKTATISFGQAMPEDAMRRAEAVTLECDLFIVVGSSLIVYPAAGFPELAKHIGATLVILNREETPLDGLADLVLHQEIGPTLSYVVGIN